MSRGLVLCSLLAVTAACRNPDPQARERIVERDQLRREVAGFRSLHALPPGTILDREHEVLVSVTDTLLRSLLEAAFPLTIDIRNHAKLTIASAAVVFRANVARVDLTGVVRRTNYPHISAAVRLRGALDRFTVAPSQGLRARISIDDASIDTPRGTLAAFDPLVVAILRSVVERSLPELTERLPVVAIPVRLDQSMTLPGFGPDAVISLVASAAPMSVEASRIIAFENRLWIILHVELGSFVAATPSAAP